MIYPCLFLLLLCIHAVLGTLNPIVITGQKFFDSVTKEQFFIKGVAYQPRGNYPSSSSTPSTSSSLPPINDPLADSAACARDAPMMKALGANVVRVYEVDPSKDHDACMKTFADNGLYLLLDIATPTFSINRKKPEYDVTLFQAYRATVSSFAKYPHVLAFIAGNEVTNDRTNTLASSYVKAVIRDMKAFLGHQPNQRPIPIGYASNDDELIRDSIKDYFVCGDPATQADFFGVNLYEWCGGSSFEKSGYAARTKEFEHYGKPVFLSEYGCNVVRPRTFGEVEAVYGPQMTPVWSGGVVYEWTQENNEYGLVSVKSRESVEPLADYHNLQRVLQQVSPQGVTMNDYQPEEQDKTARDCPAMSDNWKVTAQLPPTPSEGACQCMQDNLNCVASDAIIKSTSNITLGAQLDTMCGIVNCQDISHVGQQVQESEITTEEKFGAFSFCRPHEKLSYLYHNYISAHAGSKCDFNGYAQPVTPSRHDLDTCSSIPANLDDNIPAQTSYHNTSPSVITDSPFLYVLLALTFFFQMFWV